MPNGRCYLHGGPNPGAPMGEANGMYRHGRYTKAAIAERRMFRELLQAARAQIQETRVR